MAGYIGTTPVPQATQHRESFTATGGQTSFATAGYTPQFIDVYLNGVKLAPADFTATNGSDVVLASGATASDILEIVAYTPFEVANQTFTGTTTANNLTVTGAFTSQGIDDNANAVAITIDSSENVGIGTSSPSAELHIEKSSADAAVRLVRTGYGYTELIGSTGGSGNDFKINLNGTDRFHIQNSSGNVGIGTSSPAEKVDIAGNDANAVSLQIVNSETASASVLLGQAGSSGYGVTSWGSSVGILDGTNGLAIGSADPSAPLLFYTSNSRTERMRIDSSGNLLVGRTAEGDSNVGHTFRQDGFSQTTRSGGLVADFNRLSSDGDICRFQKDGTAVGSIGNSGSDLILSNGNGSQIKLGNNEIVPTSSGKDLGNPTDSWRDIFLSGGVYLGGTGSANKLDDYEEGTWTPSIGGATTDPTVTYTTQAGFYVKIGRMVHISMYLNCTAVSGGSGAAKITGIPFNTNNAGSYFAASQMEIFGLNVPSNMNNAVLRINGNSGHFRLEFINTQAGSTGGTGVGVGTGSLANNFRVLGSFTYMTS